MLNRERNRGAGSYKSTCTASYNTYTSINIRASTHKSLEDSQLADAPTSFHPLTCDWISLFVTRLYEYSITKKTLYYAIIWTNQTHPKFSQ